MKNDALKRAIRSIGTAKQLAGRIGITEQAVSQWRRVPASRVLLVEQITGVPRHELRPDLYPVEREAGSTGEHLSPERSG